MKNIVYITPGNPLWKEDIAVTAIFVSEVERYANYLIMSEGFVSKKVVYEQLGFKGFGIEYDEPIISYYYGQIRLDCSMVKMEAKNHRDKIVALSVEIKEES